MPGYHPNGTINMTRGNNHSWLMYSESYEHSGWVRKQKVNLFVDLLCCITNFAFISTALNTWYDIVWTDKNTISFVNILVGVFSNDELCNTKRIYNWSYYDIAKRTHPLRNNYRNFKPFPIFHMKHPMKIKYRPYVSIMDGICYKLEVDLPNMRSHVER